MDPLKAVLSLAKALKRIDDANPDIGMGPGYATFISEAAKELGYTLTHNEMIALVNEWRYDLRA